MNVRIIVIVKLCLEALWLGKMQPLTCDSAHHMSLLEQRYLFRAQHLLVMSSLVQVHRNRRCLVLTYHLIC